MPSVKLSSEMRTEIRGWFNPTLFKKNVTRFWPIWAMYTAMLFFLLPMELISYGSRGYGHSWDGARSYVVNMLTNTAQAGVGIALVFGLLTAMALFSYLMNHRSCQLLHGLPIRREGLFVTNWLSGLWFFVVPNGVIALLSGLIGMAFHLPVFPDVWLWFLIMTALDMFFFCFAMCCAMFTGHILALPAFYGVLNALVIGMSFLIDLTLRQLLIGFSGTELSETAFVRWCTPAYQLSHLLWYSYNDTAAVTLYNELYSPVGAICYCIVLGAVFTFIAGVTYRYRQLERSGDLVTVGWVRPVFQYGFGTCVGLSFGWVLFQNFFEGAWSLITVVIICAAIGAFAGRMMLKKTLRVFKDGWKGVAVFCAVLLFLLAGARADLFGYQRWTPDPAKVKSVTIYHVDSAPWDSAYFASITLDQAEDVAAVVDFHAALVSDLARLENGWNSYYTYGSESGKYQQQAHRDVRISYTMTDGSQTERRWSNVPFTTGELAQEDSYTYKLQALLNRPAAIQAAYLGDWGEDKATPVGGWLSGATEVSAEQVETSATITVDVNASEDEVLEQYWAAQDVAASTNSNEVTLETGEAKRLWQAMQADLAAGNLGRRYLLETEERYNNCYKTDLVITFMRVWTDDTGKRKTATEDVSFCIQSSATETMKALEALGYKDRLVPWTEDEI